MGENICLRFDPKRLKKTAIAVLVLFSLLLVGTVLQWGIASDWGQIRVMRVQFVTEGGTTASGLMMVPKGVNQDNPRPAILNFHGRNNSSFNLINWAMEEARRGYIVFSPDLAGTVETDRDNENTRDRINKAAYEYLQSLDMVTEISVTAHSMGNMSILDMIGREGETQYKLKNFVDVGGTFFWGFGPREFPKQTNFLIIEGSADIFLVQSGGGYQKTYERIAEKSGLGDEFEIGKFYGDASEGTAFQYVELEGMTHQGELYSKRTISTMLNFIGLSSPAPVALPDSDMIFPAYQVTSAICFLIFLVLVPAIALLIASLPGIYSIVNIPLARSDGKPTKAWLFHLITDLLIPIALFVPVTNFIEKKFPNNFWPSTWINQILFWLFALSIVSAIFIAIRCIKKKKTSALTPADFGMGLESERIFNWKRILIALVIGTVTAVILFWWMDMVFVTTGLNYQFNSMPGQIMRGSPERVIYTIRYLLFMLPVYIVININIATTRRMKTTGNETRDTIRDVLVNIVLSAGALTLLMAIQFGGIRILGNGTIPLNTKYWNSLAFGWSFPLMMSTAAGGSTFLYRKTGNIWVGTFTTCIVVIAITVFQCTTM